MTTDMATTDIITELDVEDPEVREFSVYVYCETCDDDPAPAIDMIRQWDGSWLCWPCHQKHQGDFYDWLATAEGR